MPEQVADLQKFQPVWISQALVSSVESEDFSLSHRSLAQVPLVGQRRVVLTMTL